MNKKLDFRNYFKFPLRTDIDEVYVWDSDNNIVFNMTLRLTEAERKELGEVLNGKKKGSDTFLYNFNFEYDGDCHIYNTIGEKFNLLLSRGWGYLTSPSCCGLSNEDAAYVQDELAKYCIKLINE